MTIRPRIPPRHDGHYDDVGQWQRTKFCFRYCGPELCTCQPPGGKHYSERHDKRKQQTKEPTE